MTPFLGGAKNGLQVKTSLNSIIKTRADHLDESVLHRKYVLEGLSAKQIAKEFRVAKSTILAALKRYEIPRREARHTKGRPAHPPYGKRYSGGRLVDYPAEQRVINLIGSLFREHGKNPIVIARELTDRGIPTKTGKREWHHIMVRLILKRYGLRK